MKETKKKWKSGDGFTLIEMLIVVAIIAILIAVSVPLIGNALEKTRIAADTANERAAKAELLIAYMTDAEIYNNQTGSYISFSPTAIYGYDNVTGGLKLVNGTSDMIEPYGQCEECMGKLIYVMFDEATMTVNIKWAGNYRSEGRPDSATDFKKEDKTHLPNKFD